MKFLDKIAMLDLVAGTNYTDLALDVDLIENLERGDVEGVAQDIIIQNLFD